MNDTDLISYRPIKIPQATQDRIVSEVIGAASRLPRDLEKWKPGEKRMKNTSRFPLTFWRDVVPHIVGFCIMAVIVVAANIAVIAGAVWIVVKVLQWMGVL